MALQELSQAPKLGIQNLLRVVLDPAGLGVDLRELALYHVDHLAIMIDKDGTRRGGSLIKGNHVLGAYLLAHLR